MLVRAFEIVRKATPVPPVVAEPALVNSDRLNIEAGFLKPEERLSSYDGLYTDEFLH